MSLRRHRVAPGDRLSTIARTYGVGVADLLDANPQKPRARTPGGAVVFAALSVGEEIGIPLYPAIPGTGPMASGAPDLFMEPMPPTVTPWVELWREHVDLTWQLLHLVADRHGTLPTQAELAPVLRALVVNKDAIVATLAEIYGERVTPVLNKLLLEHLEITGQIIRHAVVHDPLDALQMEWERNAKQIAQALASLNSYWSRATLERMWLDHLKLTLRYISATVQGERAAALTAFTVARNAVAQMARMLDAGVKEQLGPAYVGAPFSWKNMSSLGPDPNQGPTTTTAIPTTCSAPTGTRTTTDSASTARERTRSRRRATAASRGMDRSASIPRRRRSP